MKRALQRPEALADIAGHALWLADRSPEAAKRFRVEVERTVGLLADQPRMGAPRRYRDPALDGLRMHPVRGFPEHSVFYLPLADGVEVVRVLHAKRNIRRLLDERPAEADEGRSKD